MRKIGPALIAILVPVFMVALADASVAQTGGAAATPGTRLITLGTVAGPPPRPHRAGSLPLNTIARTLGYDIVEAESGRVVITAVPNDTHLNPAGGVHGGLSAALLDSAMGLAILSTLDKGIGETTLEFKISLVRAITPETGLIRAEGTVLNRGRRIGTAEGRITDDKGRLLSHGTTTCLIFPR